MAEPSTSPHQNTTTTATATAATITTTTTTTTLSWGTLEELLLACAVNRYGTDSWDSIARELQNLTTFSLFTPNVCQQKYRDLKKRFGSDDRNAAETSTADDASLCLDELRRLRVAELRRDLQRYDHSIVSLQLKVKKLKEEREKSVKDESDLDKNQENSTAKNEPESQTEPDRVEPVKTEPGGESCNGSSNSKEEGEERRKERVDSGELMESVAESKEGVKENSDVQSTASLWRSEINEGDNNNNIINNKNNNGGREKKVGVILGSSSGEENQSPGFKVNDDGKSQPLIEFLDVVRGRKLGSYFERRLQVQETPKYTNLIRQHIDLETIQRKLEEGQYADCHTKFYRDLMLLINNAIIFFTERSSEHKAALELRQLLDKQFRPHLSPPQDLNAHLSKPAQPAPQPKPSKLGSSPAESTDVKPKLTITGPVIACKKRSSITGKSSRTRGEKKESPILTESSEKPLALEMKQLGEKASLKSLNSVTKKRSREQSFGSRSSSSKNHSSNLSPKTPVISGKLASSEAKGDKRKPCQGNSNSKLKQSSGSDKNTLLELLKNSDKRKTTHNSSSGGSGKSDRRKDEGPLSKLVKEKAKSREERESPGSRSNRRPPKRAAAMATGKRSRNGGEAESQPRKRERK